MKKPHIVKFDPSLPTLELGATESAPKEGVQMDEQMIWKSYSIQERVDLIIEAGYTMNAAEDYASREEFSSLPLTVRARLSKI